MNISIYIAHRVSLSQSGRRKSPAVNVAIAAVALSVAVMLASLAIVAGFKEAIRDKVFGFNSHLTLTLYDNTPEQSNLILLSPTLESILEKEEYITSSSAEISVPAIFKTDSDFKGIYLKGVSGGQATEFLGHNLVSGKMPDFNTGKPEMQVAISSQAASELGLKTGDKINTYFITDEVKVRKMEITGIFNTHLESYDDIYAYTPIDNVREIVNVPADKCTSIHLSTDNYDRIPEYTVQLAQRLNQALADGEIYTPLRVENAFDQGTAFFSWLALLDTNVAVILILMTIVSIVTLISALLILILEQRNTIGILRSIGATKNLVSRVFVNLAIRITAIGMIIGNAVMLLLLWLQERFHFIPLDADSYYIDYVPVRIESMSILILNAGIIAIIFFALLLPSRAASAVSPAETMRYE